MKLNKIYTNCQHELTNDKQGMYICKHCRVSMEIFIQTNIIKQHEERYERLLKVIDKYIKIKSLNYKAEDVVKDYIEKYKKGLPVNNIC